MCTPFIAYIGLKSKMVALILRFKKQSIFYESSSDGSLTNSLIRLFMEVQRRPESPVLNKFTPYMEIKSYIKVENQKYRTLSISSVQKQVNTSID